MTLVVFTKFTMHWGLSEALDLVDKYRKYNKNESHDAVEELNFLLFGAGDVRHVLETLAQQQQQRIQGASPVQLNFYLVDGCVDVVARNLLLLDIILSQDLSLSLLGRTHLFMDIYGNSFIRPVSRDYQRSSGKFFTDLFASQEAEEISQRYSPIIDLSGLKYRDKDQLNEVFSSWRSEAIVEPPLKSQWETQLRRYLGQRYDSRRGAFDWDLHMELKSRGGERICNQEYVDFRETGIAFQFPEFEYSFENKTLMVLNEKRTFHLMTDMHTGPYPAFGLHCEDDEMRQSSHGENFYRSTDITERNVLKILYNIRQGESPSYEQLRKHKLGAARFIPGNILTAEEEQEALEMRKDKKQKLIEMKNVKIHFLSPEMMKKLCDQVKYKSFFHVAFIGASCFQYLGENFKDCLKQNAIATFELLRLSLLRKDKRDAFEEELKRFAKASKLDLMTNFNLNKQYTTYDYKNKGSGKDD